MNKNEHQTQRWIRVQALFEAVLDCAPEQRNDYLRAACGADHALIAEVQSLVEASEGASQVIESAVVGAANAVVEPGRHPPGQRVGAYELDRELARGGMGTVFLAHRADDEFRQQVAIKFVGGVLSEKAIKRFKLERQALAVLNHPYIAHLNEGGTTADGQPYLVMEYVKGKQLLAYCDDACLNIAARLELFAKVCEAVQHAHESGILHRDLKPSNILVTEKEVPKLLDFGIAKLLERGDDPTLTATGLRLLTPAYASPEQVLGIELGPASDVYTLGVLLYELCTGCKPYDSDDASLSTLERLICYRDPTKPSEVVTEETCGEEHAAQRGTEISILRETLAGQLDNVVLKALRKEPGRRYASAQALADDLRRYVAGQRVRAEAPALSYRIRRFWQRHRFDPWQVALAMLLTISVGFAVYYLPGAGRHASNEAEWNVHERYQRGEDWLHRMDEKGAIDAAIADFLAVVQRDPTHAAAFAGLALAYCMHFRDEKSDETWLERARASAQQAVTLDDQLALAHSATAWVRTVGEEADIARQSYDRALSLDPTDYFALWGLSDYLTKARSYDEAFLVLARAIQFHPDERVFLDQKGTAYYQLSDYVAAEEAFRESIRLKPDSVYGYANLNAALMHQGKLDEAIGVLQAGLKIRQHSTLYTNLGTALFAARRYQEAIQAFEKAVSGEHGQPNNYLRWANLADAYRVVPNRQAEAKDAYTRALQLIRPLLDRTPDDPTLISRAALYGAKIGAFEPGLGQIQQAIELAPDSATVHFRATVVYELAEQREQSLEHLELAIQHGYPINLIKSEPELVALRRDKRYHELFIQRGVEQ